MLKKLYEEKKNSILATWKSIREMLNLCGEEESWLMEINSKLDELYGKFRTTTYEEIYVLIEKVSVSDYSEEIKIFP